MRDHTDGNHGELRPVPYAVLRELQMRSAVSSARFDRIGRTKVKRGTMVRSGSGKRGGKAGRILRRQR